MKKITLLVLSVCLTTSLCYSQMNLQIKGSYIRNLEKENAGNTFGTGFTLEFGGSRKALNLYTGASYNFPLSIDKNFTARAYDNFTDPSTIDVAGRHTLTYYRIELGNRFYFLGEADNYEGANIYVNLGGELLFVTNKASYQEFDRDLYTLGSTGDVNEDGSNKFATNLMFVVGAGIERNLGPGNIFLNVGIAIPAPQTSDDITSIAPIPLNFNLGYKIFFGGR